MKPQQPSRKLHFAAGASLTLVLGGLGILGSVVEAQQNQSVRPSQLANGTYLYGETPQPDQVGKGYVVFAYQSGKVRGAFYYPLSEFDCFTGSMQDNTLRVQSVGAGDPELKPVAVDLMQMYQIQPVREGDYRILSTCEQVSGEPRP